MRLLKLDITGFKSFQEKTTLLFPRGITAVVGPNGCGKSNIVDALRWVMGEQSVKQLRGKSMEDLIFSGADGKQPLNMAEVSLLIENTSPGSPDSPMSVYTEIMVTRRLYRSGESVYMINRQACRLKDIHNLFLGSGSGKNSFAVIQQGNIGAVTDASPEERRFFIEDAADITKYKERKKETLTRIKTTRENLLRISDIMVELKRQISTLDRQAAKAKKYKEYKAQIKNLDISIALWHFENLSRSIREKTETFEQLSHSEKNLSRMLLDLEIRQADIRQQLTGKKQDLAGLSQKKFESQRSLDKKESDLTHLAQESLRIEGEIKDHAKRQKDLAEKNRVLEQEIAEARNTHVDIDGDIRGKEQDLARESKALEAMKQLQKTLELDRKSLNQAHMVLAGDEAKNANVLAHASQRKDDMTRRLKRMDEELLLSERSISQARTAKNATDVEFREILSETEHIIAEKNTVGGDLKRARETRDSLRSNLKNLEIELSARLSRYNTLKTMEQQFGWYKDGVKAVMNHVKTQGRPRIHGVTADHLQPEKGFEKSVEALLGDRLQYIVVDSADHAAELIAYLKDKDLGQCGFINREDIRPPEVSEEPKGPERLSAHVSFAPEDRDLVHALLDQAMIADDLDQALAMRRTLSPPFSIVTPQGDLVTGQGLIVGGGKQNGSSLFDKKNELQEAQDSVADLEEKKSRLSVEFDGAENQVRHLTLKESELSDHLKNTEKEKTRLEKELFMAGENVRQAERKREILGLEQDRILGEDEDIVADMERSRSVLEQIRDQIRLSETKISEVSGRIHDLHESVEKQAALILELNVAMTRLKATSDNYHSSLKRLEDFLNEGRNRLVRLEHEAYEKKEKLDHLALTRTRYQDEQARLVSEQALVAEDHLTCQRELSAIEKSLKETETERTRLEKQREHEKDILRDLDLDLSQQKIKRENITARIEEKYHHRINQYKLEFEENEHDRLDITTLNIPFLEAELEDLNARLAQLGDVNLGAISEYEELKTRYDFMDAQEKDLNRSLDDLETIIQKINDVSKDRFLETFNAINDKLETLFSTLFEGGNAKMMLTDPSAPLETGVELMIQPPGKKITRLSLMSGGEKALSAIAFVFSIFLIRPSSFCIMDEIDAPLDDANVTRFNNLVQHIGEQSQILMITHNKVTMEFADILFGVTMEKKGVSRIVSVSLTQDGELDDSKTAGEGALSPS